MVPASAGSYHHFLPQLKCLAINMSNLQCAQLAIHHAMSTFHNIQYVPTQPQGCSTMRRARRICSGAFRWSRADLLLTKGVHVQHLIIDGSPKWDIYRTVPISSASSTSAVASVPQTTKAASAERSAPAAPAKRDRLLEAATKGGVLLSSKDYTSQVASLSLMRCMLDLQSGSCLHVRWRVK